MADLKEIQTHMKTVASTMKITNAMYLISSAKMKSVKRMLDKTLPYFEMLQSMFKHILTDFPEISSANRYFKTPSKEGQRGFIVITGDKGLCGSYNHNVIAKAIEEISNAGRSTVFLVGNKGISEFRRKNIPIDGEFLYMAQNPTPRKASKMTESIMRLYSGGFLDEVNIVYTQFFSAIKNEPRVLRLLPLERTHDPSHKYESKAFLPTPEKVLEKLIPDYITGMIYGAMVESFSSEQSARMMAMSGATESARALLDDLSLEYNRARQAAITQQISEIVGGSLNYE